MNVEELKKSLQNVRPHKGGYHIIKEALIWLLIANGILYFLQIGSLVFQIFSTFSILAFVYIIFAFRNPERKLVADDEAVFSPVDGKVVAIENVDQADYFNDRRIKISFYTAPFEVHVKRVPMGGKVESVKFEHGNLTETVFVTSRGYKVMTVQKAGYFRKFMFSFADENTSFEQGDELGILGSGFDLILPASMELKVKVGDKVRANESVIARFR